MRKIKERLGCSTITLRQLSLSQALEAIASTGLLKVDIACIPGFCPHIDPLEITHQDELALLNLLHSLGLTVSTLNVSAGGLNTDRKDDVYRFIEAAIGLSARLGCYAITIPSGAKVSPVDLWEENARVSAQYIRRLADRATDAGIQLTLEAPHTGTLAETVTETHRFYALLNDPRVGCTFDTSHVARGNPTPVAQCLTAVGAKISHIHLRDCIGENNHLTPGKGEIDFKAVFQKLLDLGYTRDLIIELEGEDSQQAINELTSAINYLDNLGE